MDEKEKCKKKRQLSQDHERGRKQNVRLSGRDKQKRVKKETRERKW